MNTAVKKGYQLPPTYRLGSSGCGCFMEPPNHPRYFVRSIYTQYGNNPPYSKPCYYLNGNGYTELEQIDKLYKPLPLESERVQEWIKALYRHLTHCYKDPLYGNDNIIYPVPYYKLKTFVDDVRFSDEWRASEKTNVERANAEIEALYKASATPDNHSATIIIRKYYPEFVPSQELINNPPKSNGDWWTRLDKRPTPDTCPGDMGHKHPLNGEWCQFCGWHKGE